MTPVLVRLDEQAKAHAELREQFLSLRQQLDEFHMRLTKLEEIVVGGVTARNDPYAVQREVTS